MVGFRGVSSLKKSLGNLLDAAEEEILLVFESLSSVSMVSCLLVSLSLFFETVSALLDLLSWKETFWKMLSDAFLLLVTMIGMFASIN